MTAVLTVKTQRKRILCIYRTDYQLSRNGINLSASKTCYITSIFAHILRLIIQNRLHLLLKELLHSKFNAFTKFIAKSTYRLLKRPLKKKIDRNTRTTKARHPLRSCLERKMLITSVNLRKAGMASRNLVIKNNTRCLKSALQ